VGRGEWFADYLANDSDEVTMEYTYKYQRLGTHRRLIIAAGMCVCNPAMVISAFAR
jgi:hypothetical protein